MYTQKIHTLWMGLLALGFMSTPAIAAQPLSLSAAVQAAMQNSPALQKAEAQRDEGKWKGVEGFTGFLPTISLSANHFFEKKFELLDVAIGAGPIVEIPQIFPTSSATLDAKWVLFDGLSNVNSYKGAQSLKTAAEANYIWTRFQLERQVTLAYEKVVAAKKLEDVADQNLKTLDNHLNQIKQLKSGGLATNYDVLRVESQLSEAQADLLQSKDNTLIAQERLGQVLGQSESVDATDTELAVPASDKIKDLSFHAESDKRLDLVSLRNQVQASDQFDSAHANFWVPKIGLLGQYVKYNNLSDTLSDWDRYRSAWSAGFFLSWDIFNPREFAQAKQENYKAVEAQKSLIQANLQAPVDFAFWKKRYLYSASLYQAKKVDLDRANETVRLGQAGFKAGVRTTTEVLDAELELFRARAGIVNAQMNCLEAKINLELSLGETI